MLLVELIFAGDLIWRGWEGVACGDWGYGVGED